MQNFREKYAYKVSLYLSITFWLLFIFICYIVFSFDIKTINLDYLLLLLVIPALLRFISLDKLKHWGDIIIFPAYYCLMKLFVYSVIFLAPIFFSYQNQFFIASIFIVIIAFSNFLSVIFSIVFSIKYLLELRKRDKQSNT
jgi:hypothetical protein